MLRNNRRTCRDGCYHGTARVNLTAKLACQIGVMLVGVAVLDPAPSVAAPATGAVIAILLPVHEEEIRADLNAAEQQPCLMNAFCLTNVVNQYD